MSLSFSLTRNRIQLKKYIRTSQSGVLPKVGCTRGVFGNPKQKEPPKVGWAYKGSHKEGGFSVEIPKWGKKCVG